MKQWLDKLGPIEVIFTVKIDKVYHEITGKSISTEKELEAMLRNLYYKSHPEDNPVKEAMGTLGKINDQK